MVGSPQEAAIALQNVTTISVQMCSLPCTVNALLLPAHQAASHCWSGSRLL